MIPAVLLLAGCGRDDRGGGDDDRTTVTATTTHVADLVRNVGGDRLEVRSLLTPNSDPHDYDVRPSDVRAVAESDVVFRAGGEVDEWLGEVVDSARGDATVVDLLDAVKARGGGDAGAPDPGRAAEAPDAESAEADPHWWQDPRNAQAAVERIRDVLADADPAGAETYRRNAREYLESLRALDRAVADCWSRVPESRRKLVTTHDALAYYADRYGIKVIGTVIPSRSTEAQASAGRVSALVETIRREDVRAIFAERSVSPRVEAAIAREAGAKLGRPLWVDALGPADSDGATYVDSIRSNTQAMVEGLTGRRCSFPES